MQHRKIVEDYLNTVIPKNLSEEKKSEIRAEIECHIYDRADFYMEIGYDEATAFEKAVEQMGEAEPVRAELTAIHQDSSLKGFLLFFGLCGLNLLSIIAGWGYAMLPDPPMEYLPDIFTMGIFLAVATYIIVYTVKCCRQKLHKQLTGITSAFILMALGSFITSGLFYPIFSGIVLNLEYIFSFVLDANEGISGFASYWINVIFLCVYALICFIKLHSDSRFRKKKHLLSLKSIAFTLSFLSMIMIVNYFFSYEKYEYWSPDQSKQEYYADMDEKLFTSNITAEQRAVYISINKDDDIKETEKVLVKNGFKKYNESYEKYLDDNYSFSYDIDEKLKARLKENVEDNSYIFYYYINSMDDQYRFDDVISCILVSYSEDGKVKSKFFIDDSNNDIDASYQSRTHGEEVADWFSRIKLGDDSLKSMEFIRTTGATIFEGEKYTNKNTYAIYDIYLNCFYLLDVDFIDILFNIKPESVNDSYCFEIRAENGMIADLKDFYKITDNDGDYLYPDENEA